MAATGELVWYALYVPYNQDKFIQMLRKYKPREIVDIWAPDRCKLFVNKFGDVHQKMEKLYPGYVFIRVVKTGLTMAAGVYQVLKKFRNLGLRRILSEAYITEVEIERIRENMMREIEVEAGPDPRLALETEQGLFTLPETLLVRLHELVKRNRENAVRFVVNETFSIKHIFLLSYNKLLHILSGTKLYGVLVSLTGT